MKSADNIKKFFNKAAINTNPSMDKAVMNKILMAHEKTKSAAIKPKIRRTIMKNPITKLAAVLALICMGVAAAAVVGIKIHKWRIVDKHPEAGYLLLSEDGRTMTNVPESWADSPEHAVEVKEELDLLKQQGKRKLVGVSEFKVNGQLDSTMFTYEYTLSDGRVIRKGEHDPDDNTPQILVGERWDEASQRYFEITAAESVTRITDPQTGEVRRIRKPAEGVVLTTYEQVVQGRVLSFEARQFALSEGTEVTWAFGTLKDGQ